MPQNYTDRYEEMAKDLIGTEKFFEVKKLDLDAESIIRFYHSVGRDKEELNRRINALLHDEELIRFNEQADRFIERSAEEIEKVKEMRTATVKDQFYNRDEDK